MSQRGRTFELLASEWLRGRGLTIIQHNYRCKAGEIDLIARDGSALVFVEVRARSNPRFASAAASVDQRKQRRLLLTAEHYLRCHPASANLPCRFDVVAIEPRQFPASPAVRWIRSAFTG